MQTKGGSPAVGLGSPQPWALAGGSAIGREHRRLGRNSQDAWGVAQSADLVVAVVADGCSSGAHSEVGAQLAVRWMVSQLPGLWRQAGGSLSSGLAQQAGAGLLEYWRAVVAPLVTQPADWARRVGDLLLSTVLVAALDAETGLVFGVGDGVVAVDGCVLALSAGSGNAPPYLAYRLLGEDAVAGGTAECRPRVHAAVLTASVSRLVIATDGCLPLLAGEAGREASRLDTLLGEPRIYRNPSLLQKRLRMLGEEPGLLGDDATLVAITRRADPCAS